MLLAFARWSVVTVVLGVFSQAVEAQITVYGQTPLAHQTTSLAEGRAPLPTLAAYDGTVLIPPPPPNPPVTALTINVPREATALPGLSIPHTGASFWGFSVEMSVITQTSACFLFRRAGFSSLILMQLHFRSWKEFVSSSRCRWLVNTY